MISGRPLALTAAVLAPVAAGALLSRVRGLVTNNNAALVLVLVVVAVAATGHRVAGLVAAVVSAASFDFFLTQPYLQFAITERDDIEAAVLLGLIGLAVTEIALWGRRQQARSSTRAGYLSGVVSAARLASTGSTAALDVADLVAPPDPRPARPRRLPVRACPQAGPGPAPPAGRRQRSPGGTGSSTSTARACRRSTPSSCR